MRERSDVFLVDIQQVEILPRGLPQLLRTPLIVAPQAPIPCKELPGCKSPREDCDYSEPSSLLE